MAINFPNTIDALINPTATDLTKSVPHASQHANANDAIEALEAKVGVNNSTVASSLDYKVKTLQTTTSGLTSTVNGHTSTINSHTTTLGTHGTEIDDLQANDIVQDSAISNLESNTSSWASRIGVLESDIPELDARLDVLELQAKALGWITVARDGTGDFNCDGASDNVEIQLAINAARATGGPNVVFFKQGTYNFSAGVQKYGVTLIGTNMFDVNLVWNGSDDEVMFYVSQDRACDIKHITFDGGDKADGVTAILPTAQNHRMNIERCIFKNLGVGINTGPIGDQGSNIWDSGVHECFFSQCGVGMEMGEYEFNNYNNLYSYCDIGVKFNTNSNCSFHGGTFTHCGKDVYFAGHPENISFFSVWFEESTDLILEAAANSGWVKTLGFYNCRLHTRSTEHMMDLTNVNGNVLFSTCDFRESDVTPVTSTTIIEGEYSQVSYQHCYYVDKTGASFQKGDLKIFNTMKINQISELIADQGVDVEGNIFKDTQIETEFLFAEYAVLTNDFYCYGTGNTQIFHDAVDFLENAYFEKDLVASGLAINSIFEKTAGLGVGVEGVIFMDSSIKSLSGVKIGQTQIDAGASTNEFWRTSSHATLPDGVLMIGI